MSNPTAVQGSAAMTAALALLSPEEAQNLHRYTAEVDRITRTSTATALTTQLEAATLSELMSRGKRAADDVDSLRREITDPLNDQVKSVNNLFRPLADALKAFLDRSKRLQVAWQDAEEARVRREQDEARRQQEEAARREAEAEARAAEASDEATRREAMNEAERASQDQVRAAVLAPVVAPRAHRTESGGSGVRVEWAYEVVDEAQVPRQYLIVDEKKLRAAVLSGERQIPGVNVFQRKGWAVRG